MPRILEESPPARPAYFWWFLANLLAICFAIITWAVCLHVFGNPEIPRNYEILRKLHRLPVLKRHKILDAPNGNALNPKELYQKYFGFTEAESTRLNSLLLRNYLTNFDRPLLLSYVQGDYQIREIRKLTSKDFFSPGVVICAQAMIKPDDFTKPLPYPVFVEYLFPTPDSGAEKNFKLGDTFTIRKSPNYAAVVHISKVLNEGDLALLLTVIPIAYDAVQPTNTGSFRIEPPAELRPAAGLPVIKK